MKKMKNFRFYVWRSWGIARGLPLSEIKLAQEDYEGSGDAFSKLVDYLKRFLSDHIGVVMFSEALTDVEKRENAERKELSESHYKRVMELSERYGKTKDSALLGKIRAEEKAEDESYEASVQSVRDRMDAERKRWRCYKPDDVDAFLGRCKAYRKEKGEDESVQLYAHTDTRRDTTHPPVDVGVVTLERGK